MAMPEPIPVVLVLLAAFNGASWIDDQIESVLAQRGVRCRILVADDGSTDGTFERLQMWSARDPRVTALPASAPTGSGGANFIRLIAMAEAEDATHIAFCDQDDVWKEWKLHDAIERLGRAGADLASASVLAFWPDGRRGLLSQSTTPTRADYLFEGAGQGCSYVLTRDLFAAVQAFVRSHRVQLVGIHYHDWFVYALARVWHRTWVFDPAPCLLYRQHSQNDTGARGTGAGACKRLALIRSGWYLKQILAIAAICITAAPENVEAARVQRYAAQSSKSLLARPRWVAYVLFHSRRRWRDRIALAASAALGYI